MRKIVLLAMGILVLATVAMADTAPATFSPGWGPSVVGSVGAFYMNGNYNLMAAGVNVGSAYTWDDQSNVNSIGVYLGPQSSQVAGVTSTSLNAMVFLDFYKTAAAGSFGVGFGTRLWQSGIGMNRAVGIATTYLALGYQF